MTNVKYFVYSLIYS